MHLQAEFDAELATRLAIDPERAQTARLHRSLGACMGYLLTHAGYMAPCCTVPISPHLPWLQWECTCSSAHSTICARYETEHGACEALARHSAWSTSRDLARDVKGELQGDVEGDPIASRRDEGRVASRRDEGRVPHLTILRRPAGQ